MALEKEVVEQGLETAGLNKALADNLSFDTEEQMNATLNGLKPRTFETIEDVLKDEKLSTIVRTYGDKRQSDLQSKIDKEKADKDKPKYKDDKDKPKDEEPEWAKTLREQQEIILKKSESENFDKLITKLGKAEKLDDAHIARVKKGLKSDATEAEIKSEITSYKKEMADFGIKDFGTPGGGNKGNSSIKSTAEKWKEKHKKKNEK